MAKFADPIRHFYIDVLILFSAIVGFVILLRPDLLQSESLLSAASILSQFGIFACVLVFLGKLISNLTADRRRYRAQKRELRKQAFKIAIKRQKANVQAQLNKPAFKERLQSFTGRQLESESLSEPAKSNAEFWEASDLELGPTAPRPIEFFRVLLQRISKYVGFGK